MFLVVRCGEPRQASISQFPMRSAMRITCKELSIRLNDGLMKHPIEEIDESIHCVLPRVMRGFYCP
jgi:hypothetical protein